MKIFDSKAKGSKYSYDNPAYTNSFGMSSLRITETNFNRLERNAQDALKKQDIDLALANSGKAALEYGVAGLCLYVDIYTKILRELRKNKEIIEQEVISLLSYIIFSKEMLKKHDPRALESMELIYSDDDFISESFWKAKEAELLFLTDKSWEIITKEANDIAHALIEACAPSHSVSNSIF